jgi:hypothetical protein
MQAMILLLKLKLNKHRLYIYINDVYLILYSVEKCICDILF